MRTFSLLALVAFLPACGEVLGAEFDDVTDDCSIEGERRCGDGLVCLSGKWTADTVDHFCAGGNVTACDGDSTQVTEKCKGPCADAECRSVEELDVGRDTTCARLDDGTVWCWGANTKGALGRDPNIPWSGTPAPVSGVSGATDIALAEGFGCALLDTGSVVCWGDGGAGAIGAHGGQWSATAVKIEPLGEVAALFAAYGTACARGKNGSFSCWGRVQAPCMQGSSDGWAAFFPVPLPELDTASSVFASGELFCGLLESEGQLACCYDGPQSDWLSSGQKVADWVAGTGVQDHVCVGSASGSVSCWGSNYRGQLCAEELLSVATLSNFDLAHPLAKMAAGSANTYFLDSRGDLRCCGNNTNSECGRPSALGELFSAPADVMSNVLSMGAGTRHACALSLDHEVFCWGANLHGQCGTNAVNLVAVPEPVVWQP